jgi:Cys-rich protein (TIGR01571 family)
MDTCLLACFCPCLVYAQNKSKLEGFDSTCISCILFTCVNGCFGLCGCMQRGTIRARYNIEGDDLVDCCAHVCCHSCAFTQEKRELEKMSRGNALSIVGAIAGMAGIPGLAK